MFKIYAPKVIPNPLHINSVPKKKLEKAVLSELKVYNIFLSELQNKERQLFVHIARLKAELAPLKEEKEMLAFLEEIVPTYHLNTYEFGEKIDTLSQLIDKLEGEIDLCQKDINGTQVRIQMRNEKIKLCARILECL